MKLRQSRPLQIDRTATQSSQSLSSILDQSQELSVASRILDHADPAKVPTDALDKHRKATADTRHDLSWQSYLNPAAPGGGIVGGHLYVSPATVGFGHGAFSASGDRSSASVGGDVNDTTIKVSTSPFSTVPTIEQRIGDEKMTGTAGGGLVVGSKVSGAFVDASTMGATSSVGLVAITDNKIQILSSPQTDANGVSRQLARFTSACTPALDINLAHTESHSGGGVRAVIALGRATTFEKYVPVDDLARMLRKRDTFLSPIIETASALGLMSGIKPPSRADLAADMGSIDAMRPGESATWLSSKLLVLGVSAGGMGLRGVAQVSTQNSSMYKLSRNEDDLVNLTVRPGKIDGLRLSLEAKVLAQLSVDAIGTAGMQRSWTFDLKYMSSRHALSNALNGRLPGFILPLEETENGYAAVWRALSLSTAESLPFGVLDAGTEFVSTISKGASLSGLRFPSFLGGSSMGISRQGIAAVYGQVGDAGATLTVSHENNRRVDLLSVGSLQESDMASFVSAVSVGPRGESVFTPKEITSSLRRETSGSSAYGRRKLAQSLEGISWVPLSFHGVQTSRRYAVEIAQTMSVDSFQKAREMTAADLKKLAKEKNLPLKTLTLVRELIVKALDDGSEKAMAESLAKISDQKHVGMLCLSRLASHVEQDVGIVNETHDKLLADFLKAETFALGCKTAAQAKSILKRTEKLHKSIEKAVKELSGDAALRLIDDGEQGRRIKFMELLRDETAQLGDDVRAALKS